MEKESSKLPWEQAVIDQIARTTYAMSYRSPYVMDCVKTLKIMLSYIKDPDTDKKINTAIKTVNETFKQYSRAQGGMPDEIFNKDIASNISEILELLIFKAAKNAMIPVKEGEVNLEDENSTP